MLEKTELGHFTVPHCGTRYINKAVTTAIGEKEYQVPSRKFMERSLGKQPNQKFVFCHIGPRWEDWIREVCAQDHITCWTTVRSPIHTWGTHWGHIEPNLDRHHNVYEKLGQLRGQYEALMRLAPYFDYIHRVDIDPVSKLGDFLGLELQEHSEYFSRHSDMKQALKDQNVDEIARLCAGTEFWRAFHDYTTPDIKDFFEDLGYDIWWYNGQRNAA